MADSSNWRRLFADWDETFRSAAHYSVFLSRPWLTNFIETVRYAERNLRVYTASPAQDRPGALLLGWTQPTKAGLLVPNTLHVLGNYYSSLCGPVLDYSAAQAPAALRQLVANTVGGKEAWDTVDIAPLEQGGLAHRELRKAFRDIGWYTQDYFCFGNWYLPARRLNFGDYLQTRPSQLRNTLRTKQRKLERTPQARVEIITHSTGLEPAIDAYETVYARSWKQAEPHPHFTPGLIRTCAEAGWLRLGIYWVGDEPAAAQVWITCNGVASIFKLAYDPTYRNYSAGSVLSMHLMRHVLEKDRVREVDYLTGDDPYKRHWMDQRRERWGLIAFNPRTLRGLFSTARNLGGSIAKQTLRQIVPEAGDIAPGEPPHKR